MKNIIQLTPATLLPILASVLLVLADRKTPFGKLSYRTKQIIYGLLFGLIAVVGTERGINIAGVVMNVRDAAPLCGGLIFGSPAGIIAGLIGGIERFIRAPWVGEYTKFACSISTILAGLIGAWVRKYLFENQKPLWYHGFVIGVITEVVHMLMVFVTNINDARNCFEIVYKCTVPMTTMVGFSVMVSIIAATLLDKEPLWLPKEKMKLSQTFQARLLICVLLAFTLTSVFTSVVLTQASTAETSNLLALELQDVTQDIADASDKNLLVLTRKVANRINELKKVDVKVVNAIAEEYDVPELNIIDRNGIITLSTDASNTDFDMSSGQQAREFLALLKGRTELVQDYQPISRDSELWFKYAGVKLAKGGFVQVGYDSERFHRDIAEQVVGITCNRHVGETGYIIICDENFNIISGRGLEGSNLLAAGMYIDLDTMPERDVYESTVYGEDSSCMYTVSEGYYIIAVRPQHEAMFSRDMSIYMTVFMEIIVFAVLFAMIYLLIKYCVVDNLYTVNDDLEQITDGNLDVTVDVRSSKEFTQLSDDINSTVGTLKQYIAEAEARIDRELEFAKSIQESALPKISHSRIATHSEVDVWASMNAAKEVGGDFYDLYMLDDENMVFLVADVSGKGIPAAMFMMKAKTMLKNLAKGGLPVEEVFTMANGELCEGNDAEMFVTAWMGILNLKTGLVTFANAGHNPPAVRHGDGSFEFLKSRAGFVLAGMDGVRYRRNELQLEPGDIIFLYTDGVTEATNSDNVLYGEDRLIKILNKSSGRSSHSLCTWVKADVDGFVGTAPQFDDITMVNVRFLHKAEEEDK